MVQCGDVYVDDTLLSYIDRGRLRGHEVCLQVLERVAGAQTHDGASAAVVSYNVCGIVP